MLGVKSNALGFAVCTLRIYKTKKKKRNSFKQLFFLCINGFILFFFLLKNMDTENCLTFSNLRYSLSHSI